MSAVVESSTSTGNNVNGLSAKIASLAMKHHNEALQDDADSWNSDFEDIEEEEEEIVEVTEEDVLHYLDSQESALQVCSRLFNDCYPACSILAPDQVDQLQQLGYTVLDDFLPKETCRQIHDAACLLHQEGRLTEARSIAAATDTHGFTDRSARGDHIMWLHHDAPPGNVPPLHLALQRLEQLKGDLCQLMRMRGLVEYQLAVYPGGGLQYVRHRDALPDDSTDSDQRKVTAIVYPNPERSKEAGGKLRIWLPDRPTPSKASAGDDTSNAVSSPVGSRCDGAAAEAAGGAQRPAASLDEVPAQPPCESGVVVEVPAQPACESGVVDGEEVVDVHPLAGRCVVFLSGAVDHAVLPSFGQRVAITAWMQ